MNPFWFGVIMLAAGSFAVGAVAGRVAQRHDHYLVSRTPPVILPAELSMYCGRSGWVMPCVPPGCTLKDATDSIAIGGVTYLVTPTWTGGGTDAGER